MTGAGYAYLILSEGLHLLVNSDADEDNELL